MTAAEIETALRNRIAYGEYLLQIAGIVRETARTMEGRKVDKRFQTAVAERVRKLMGDDWTVSYTKDGDARVQVWTGGKRPNAPTFRDYCAFRIGADTIREAYVVETNPAYFKEAEKLNNLRIALDDGKPAEWAAKAAAIVEAKAALEADMCDHAALYIEGMKLV